jgi:hypothetical protein
MKKFKYLVFSLFIFASNSIIAAPTDIDVSAVAGQIDKGIIAIVAIGTATLAAGILITIFHWLMHTGR